MPTVLMIKNLIFMIHTRDHGFPHVTVYLGTPDSHEAFAKVRLDKIGIIEADGFSKKALKEIELLTAKYQELWLEKWNEIHE